MQMSAVGNSLSSSARPHADIHKAQLHRHVDIFMQPAHTSSMNDPRSFRHVSHSEPDQMQPPLLT